MAVNGPAHRHAVTRGDRSERTAVDWSWIVDWLTKWILPFYFAAFAAGIVVFFVGHGLVGIDGRIYTKAAAVWLAGGNPWQTPVGGYLFAAPPPTLLPFVPFALLGETPSALLWVAGSAVAGVLLVRQLGLPLWWILFPPLVNGVMAGNADVVLVALLVNGGSAAGVLAAFLKIYAVAPLIGERKWSAIGLTAGALVVTLPLLPWPSYVGQFGRITETLGRQAIGISAWGTLWLMIGVTLALVRLGRRWGWWLAVPAVWPSTQLHYSALALPALAKVEAMPATVLIAAMLLAPENRWFPAIAVVVLAIGAIRASLRAKKASRSHDAVDDQLRA